MGGLVAARSLGRARLLAGATIVAVCASMLQARYLSAPISADIVSYQRVDRTFTDSVGVSATLRTRGFIDDACLQNRWWPCLSAAASFQARTTAQAYAIKELARIEHPFGPPYPVPTSQSDDRVQWDVGPAPDTTIDEADGGDAVPPNWRIDIVTDDSGTGGGLQAYEIARYGADAERATAQQRLTDQVSDAQAQYNLVVVRGHDLMDTNWAIAYFDKTGHAWCAWAGDGAGADQDRNDTGILYFAPQSDETIPQGVRQRTLGCTPQDENELVAVCARVNPVQCADDASVVAIAALLAMRAVWAQREGEGAPVDDPVPTPTRSVIGRPYAQVPDWQHMASYTVSVNEDPSQSLTLVLDYGDGVYDWASVPAGTDVWSSSFTHQFTPGFGLATQRAVITQTGQESEFITAEDTDLVPPAVLGLPDPPECVSFGQTLSAGSSQSAALTADGGVWTWGYGARALGRGTGWALDDPTPAPLSTIHGVREVVAGAGNVFAVRADGSVWSWGSNRWGQLGNGSTFSGFGGPTLVGLLGVSSVAANRMDHDGTVGQVFAIQSGDGAVWAWGANGSGQLGVGTTDQHGTPVQVGGLSGITSIASGPYQTLAANGNGTLWGWGMVGTPDQTTQTLAPEVLAGSGVRAAAVGGYGTQVAQDTFLAAMADGSIQAWGNNLYGELGLGTRSSNFVPTAAPVPGVAGIVSAGSGTWSEAALDNQGNVFTWGGNSSGMLGTGEDQWTVRPTPAVVPTTGTVSLAVGQNHVLALRPDGSVVGWGGDGHGALGNGRESGIVTTPIDALISGVAQSGGCGDSLAPQAARAAAAGGAAHSVRPAPVRGLPGSVLSAGWRARGRTLTTRTHVPRPARHAHVTVRIGPDQVEDVLVSR